MMSSSLGFMLSFEGGQAVAEQLKYQHSYPAVVDDTIPARTLSQSKKDPGDLSPLEIRKQVRAAEKARTEAAKNTVITPTAPAAEPSPQPIVLSQAEPTVPFDAVPKEHSELISKRLKIVEKLIRDYGRAYDYRTHTTQELQSILDKLAQSEPAEAHSQ